MKNWSTWFDSPKERRAYIKAQRNDAKTQGKKFRVLSTSKCRQRCTGKDMYFASFALE